MLIEYFLFLAKTFTLAISFLLVFAGILAISTRNKHKSKEKLDIKKINTKYEEMEHALLAETLSKKEAKLRAKIEKQQQKAAKKAKEPELQRKRIFLLHFHGDIRATGIKNLRQEITAILTVANNQDEVVLCLESPGGMVHAYGLAASQLQRIRQSNIPLTIIIDKVAASGGYMMASVGTKILAAPFAVVGSIGVIAQLPNFHRLLKKNDIDFEQVMAGQYKRTLTVFGENTREGRAKFQEEIDETQVLFKAFIADNRPTLPIEQVSTGEHWYGSRAIELKLIDGIDTSDDYLLHASRQADIYEVSYSTKRNLLEKMTDGSQKAWDGLIELCFKSSN